MLACLAAAVLFGAQTAHAQDPSTLSPSVQKSTSFPKQSMVGPSRNLDRSQPLYLQGDELVYDTGGNRVVARGNVEIYYNNYILTADQVVYDQSANTLTAVGNVVLKEPNGNIVRADRYTLTDDFRDGFVQSLSIVTSDDSRIAGERAVRRGGNTTVFTNGRFTPCKTNDGMPPLWCISAATVIHDQQAATITYQDAQFELFGVPVLYAPYFEHADPSVKRKSGFLMPEYAGSDPLWAACWHALLLRARAQLRFHLQSALHVAPGHSVAGRVAAPSGERPVLYQAGRHRSGPQRPAVNHRRSATTTTASAAASRRRASSRSRAGGTSGGTSRPRPTTPSAASTSSTTFWRPTWSTECSSTVFPSATTSCSRPIYFISQQFTGQWRGRPS